MNSLQIEKNVQNLMQEFDKNTFVFELLLAYGTPKATVTLLQKGKRNLSKEDHQVILKQKLFFHECQDDDLHVTIDTLQKEKKTMSHRPRFIVVTNYKNLLAFDTNTKETLDIKIVALAKHYAFFLPWAGIEKQQHKNENPADRKAAEKMAKLYDGILEENNIDTEKKIHDLNTFLARVLFCFFAEDTGIFPKNIFTDFVGSHTATNGEDLDEQLEKLFVLLDTKENDEERKNIPAHLEEFPYVNGGLFSQRHWVPKFSAKARKIILECGDLDWKDINPDIFGSMIQAVVHPGERGALGMHYTSVPNIMKVIEPLFLNELKAEFEKNKGNNKKLDALRQRMGKIQFFDPACGSGNFLIITYKELRKLEMEIIEEMGAFSFSDIHLSQFYGIEIDDFAHEIAKLSLYLAEHQMNVVFKEQFGEVKPTLPLQECGKIVCANATRIDWEEVCPKDENDEIYIFGNPPYLGARMQNKEQKEDMKKVFENRNEYKDSDYIFCWFIKGANYATQTNAKIAFVSTNSISQGEQVSFIWPYILDKKLEINFAHTSFKWGNNAKENAGVTVVIIGIENKDNIDKKYLYTNGISHQVKNITPYLVSGKTVIVKSSKNPMSSFPKMVMGSMARDGGNLILSTQEKNDLINLFPQSEKFLRKLTGAQEFLQGKERWCLWITENTLNESKAIPPIKKRIDKVYTFRVNSKAKTTNGYASIPYRLAQCGHKETNSIIIPRVSSERREYIPFGFLEKDTVISDSAQAIYDAEPWIFAIISSRMHMTWVRAVAGRLKTDYRYSSALCYNTFPIPPLTKKQKEEMTKYVYEILGIREEHSEKTMAQLYDPDKMPADLKDAHHRMDLAVERIYRSKLFESDEERLEYLFVLYEKMIGEEELNLTK